MGEWSLGEMESQSAHCAGFLWERFPTASGRAEVGQASRLSASQGCGKRGACPTITLAWTRLRTG
jgi:hypothetical protein